MQRRYFPWKKYQGRKNKVPSSIHWCSIGSNYIGRDRYFFSGFGVVFLSVAICRNTIGTYIGLFVIAQATGVFSQVPGGIGVFESIFLLALPDFVDKADIFGALLAYRIIYYVLPLIGVGGLFFIYENWLRARMKRWLAAAHEKSRKFQQKSKISAIGKNKYLAMWYVVVLCWGLS